MGKNSPVIADKKAKTVATTLDYLERNPAAQSQLLLHLRWGADVNSAYEVVPEAACTPPGSLLSFMLRGWYEGTSIPLAMPYWIALGYVSGHLAQQKVSICLPDGSSVQPQLWQVFLAPAGCGKTWTEKQIAGVFSGASTLDLSGAVSNAASVAALARKTRGVWVRDEWGQFIRELEVPSPPLAGVRDVLLRVREGQTITRERANGDPVIAADPCVSIVGVTVDTTFEDIISPESMLDGFSSRFSICYSQQDVSRPWWECPWWSWIR